MHRSRIVAREIAASASRRAVAAEPLEPRLLLAAQLLKEINPTASTQFANFLSINNTTYFTVDDDAHGTELWRTDGTPAGTTLVKDIEPGPASSSPSFLTNVNGTLFFTAKTSAYGAELWKSDGTDAGTVMVADISPGPDSGRAGIGGMIAWGNTVLFSAHAGPNDGVELWASDGTAAGTHLVKDIAGPNAGSGPADFLRAGNWVYFAASTSTGGRELWRTNGTDAGTTLVKDVRPGSYSSNPRLLGAIGSLVLFTADNGSTGDELWVTDGTAAGTTLLKDIRPGLVGAGIDYWAVAGNQLFFNAYDGTSLGDEVYVTDGTPAGTRLVKDINPNGGNGAPRYFVPFGNRVYFGANTAQNGRELWVSDGTDFGTRLVQDFYPGSLGSEAFPIGVSRGVLYISTPYGSGAADLWKLTPTAGLSLVQADVGVTLAVPNVPGGFVFAGNDGSGAQLYFSTGSNPGTRPLLRTRPFGPGDSDARDFVPFGNRYLFSANDGAHGAELWSTDGTPAGTALVKDLNPGTPYGLTTLQGATFNGAFYFTGNDGVTGNELWKTDGTPQGTKLFMDLPSGSAGASPGNYAVYNGSLYFTVLLSNRTNELWRTNGTLAGTLPLTGYYANLPGGVISAVRVIGNNLYVRTESGGEADLYRFNGNTFVNATASLPYVYDFNDAGNGQVYVNAGSQLYILDPDTVTATPVTTPSVSVNVGWGSLGASFYFSAYGATGNELYVTDGTAAGTHLVQDLYPGSTSATPANPFFHAGHLYFTALTDTGWALWSIGAPGAAPAKVLDLAPSTQFSISIAYADLGGDLHFATNGSTAAGKLWRIHDGQPEVVDPAFPYPQAGLLNVNGALLFTLSDATHGSELYRYPTLADTTPPTVTESAFLPWSDSQTVSITFDEDLAAAPVPAALQLLNLTTGQAFAPSAVTWNPYTRTLVFTTAAPLPAGDYRATLAAGTVTDVAGNALAAPHVLTFTLLRGDANGDRTVNYADLLALARNYNKTDATLADGDFNGDGVVNFADLLLLAKNYNTTLPTPPPPPPAPTPALAPLAPTQSSKPSKPTPFASKPLTPPRKPAPPLSRRSTRSH